MEANGTENERQLTLEEIKFWKVDALKDFLRIRGLKTTGLKAELQAFSLQLSAIWIQCETKRS